MTWGRHAKMVTHLKLVAHPLVLLAVIMQRLSGRGHQVIHEIALVKVQHTRIATVEGQEVVMLGVIRVSMHRQKMVHMRHVRHHRRDGHAHSHGHLGWSMCEAIWKYVRTHPLTDHHRWNRAGLDRCKTSRHYGRWRRPVALRQTMVVW